MYLFNWDIVAILQNLSLQCKSFLPRHEIHNWAIIFSFGTETFSMLIWSHRFVYHRAPSEMYFLSCFSFFVILTVQFFALLPIFISFIFSPSIKQLSNSCLFPPSWMFQEYFSSLSFGCYVIFVQRSRIQCNFQPFPPQEPLWNWLLKYLSIRQKPYCTSSTALFHDDFSTPRQKGSMFWVLHSKMILGMTAKKKRLILEILLVVYSLFYSISCIYHYHHNDTYVYTSSRVSNDSTFPIMTYLMYTLDRP